MEGNPDGSINQLCMMPIDETMFEVKPGCGIYISFKESQSLNLMKKGHNDMEWSIKPLSVWLTILHEMRHVSKGARN